LDYIILMLKGSTNDKIIRILKRMDDVLSKNCFFQYQERIHRIYKTLISIERHEGCFVSNFNPDGNNEEEFSANYLKTQESEVSNSLSVEEDGKIEIENNQKRNKLELGDIFDFIEDELNLKSLVYIEDSTVYSSSDEDEEDSQNRSIEEKKQKYKPIKDSMQKNFFNIELRLRAYLKEQELFKKYSFDSILDDSKMRTPLSKVDPNRSVLPAIIKNFFNDKAIIEAAKKRYSVRESLRSQIEKLGNAEELFKCRSYCDQLKISSTKESDSNISSFSIDTKEVGNNNADRNSLTILKRGSIFRDKFLMNEFPTVNEELNSDVSSYKSDDESGSERSYESEYESDSYESEELSEEKQKKFN
jgi:hypothetical protein